VNADDKNSKTVHMGFANLDGDRARRTGQPEVVFCQGKTPGQIAEIMAKLVEMHPEDDIFGSRADPEDYDAVKAVLPQAEYDAMARIVYVKQGKKQSGHRIAVISAGTADMPVAEEAALSAELFGNDVLRVYDVGVAGVHRLLEHEDAIRACDVVIVVAGMEGALASVVGGIVAAPIIAVPTSVGYGSNFGGLSALLSMLNSCANGVAVVNIDNGFGAACMADKIVRVGERD